VGRVQSSETSDLTVTFWSRKIYENLNSTSCTTL